MASSLGDKMLQVKIKVANRTYPLKIKASEEETVRRAGSLLNKKIEEFKKIYAADDKDVLAMSALMFAIDSLKTGNKDSVLEDEFHALLHDIESSLDKLAS